MIARLLGAAAGAVVVAFWTFMLPVLPLGAIAIALGVPLGTVAPIAAVICGLRGCFAALRGWNGPDEVVYYE